MQNPMSLGNAFIQTKVYTSKFIDTPSGVLNVVLRKMSHNNPSFKQKENSYIKIELKSRISRNLLTLPETTMSDKFCSQPFGSYHNRTEKNNKNVIAINEVAPFFIRHYSDCLLISICGQNDNSPIFTTRVELNNLDLGDQQVTV